MADEIKIIAVFDHYEVYVNGTFYCSADTMIEAVKELDKYEEPVLQVQT